MNPHAERNLLFGLVAFQSGLIEHDQLVSKLEIGNRRDVAHGREPG
jgi:hypothetical protein